MINVNSQETIVFYIFFDVIIAITSHNNPYQGTKHVYGFLKFSSKVVGCLICNVYNYSIEIAMWIPGKGIRLPSPTFPHTDLRYSLSKKSLRLQEIFFFWPLTLMKVFSPGGSRWPWISLFVERWSLMQTFDVQKKYLSIFGGVFSLFSTL